MAVVVVVPGEEVLAEGPSLFDGIETLRLEFEWKFAELRSGSGIADHERISWHYKCSCICQSGAPTSWVVMIVKYHCISTVTRQRLVEAVLGWAQQKLSTVLTLRFV